MNDARYPNISAIDNRLAELENEKQQLLALREALRSAQNEHAIQAWIQQVVALLVGNGAFTLYPVLSQCDNAAERLTRWLTYQLPHVKQAHAGCPIHQ
ncbi:hypothetical protein [Zhongshania sp.]|uniref:hypothetical protein n=1 Tax=Zhongshania sp. TaxID=1971902 RepID=UPI0035623AA8